MTALTKYTDSFREYSCCVIIPTYNNPLTLERVLRETLDYTDQVLIVNDGSTDDSLMILDSFPTVRLISYPVNKGKGYALRKGFNEAFNLGYKYAITIDSDGQHLPQDLPFFIDMIEKQPGSLVIGARNLSQDGIPGGTTFGNRFSNFWFRVETGIKLPDTQSGYRLYPLEPLHKMHFFTRRFEFEIEVIVRAAWKGVPIRSVPVSVYYPSKEERVTHFRPFWDFFRISLLNTVLVLLALLFVRPFQILRGLNRENLRNFFIKYLLDPNESNFRKAASVALGVFVGIAPIWGWQTAVALALAYFLKLNKIITLVAANISIPPMIPFILYLSYKTGGIILNNPADIDYSKGLNLEFVKNNIFQYATGALVFGSILAISLGLLTYIMLFLFRKREKELKTAESLNSATSALNIYEQNEES